MSLAKNGRLRSREALRWKKYRKSRSKWGKKREDLNNNRISWMLDIREFNEIKIY
jgi:hypothetical protein